MFTQTSKIISYDEEKDITIIRYEHREEIEVGHTRFIHTFLKWSALLLTIILAAAAFTPDTLHVPLYLRPWFFITFLFWIFPFLAGFFSQ